MMRITDAKSAPRRLACAKQRRWLNLKNLMNPAPSLLLLNISPRGERSGSRKLSDEYLSAWRAKNPHARIIVRDVGANPPPVVSEAWIAGAYSPRDQYTPAMREAIAVSDAFVDEL